MITYEANFYNVLLRTPICHNGSAHKREHAQAFHNSTGLFDVFETEPTSNSSKKNWDVYCYMLP